MTRDLKSCRRIVIKAGTTILSSREGNFSLQRLEKLGAEVAALLKDKKEVVLVSSGAIARGMEVSGCRQRPRQMARLQACAAIGQGKLMHDYEKYFAKRGLHTAQILLTRDGLEDRARFLKVRRTFEELFGMKILPIVNENDTVATDEIGFGDNDILAVQVAHLIHADLVIFLSDVDGFYLRDGSRIRHVSAEDEIDGVLVKHLKDKQKIKNVGGMRAKLEAARIAMRSGIPVLIVNGHEPDIISKAIADEDVGTIFLPGKGRANARKKWIAFASRRKGTLVVDEGAYRVISRESRSLLASGIRRSRGQFNRGEVVELETEDGKVFGRGLVRYSSREVSKISGKRSDEIRMMLGDLYQSSVIHCDDLMVWG